MCSLVPYCPIQGDISKILANIFKKQLPRKFYLSNLSGTLISVRKDRAPGYWTNYCIRAASHGSFPLNIKFENEFLSCPTQDLLHIQKWAKNWKFKSNSGWFQIPSRGKTLFSNSDELSEKLNHRSFSRNGGIERCRLHNLIRVRTTIIKMSNCKQVSNVF